MGLFTFIKSLFKRQRTESLYNWSRGKNPDAGEVVVEVLGKHSKSMLYPRGGSKQATEIRALEPTWKKAAKDGMSNPKLVLFRGEAILVRLSDEKSFVITEEGVEEVSNNMFNEEV